MNRTIVALGIIIIILGFGLSLGSNSSRHNVLEDMVAEVEDQWTISGDFHEGENLILWFTPDHDWNFPPYPDLGEPSYSKHFLVNITNKAAGSYTSFKVILVVPPDQIPPAPPYGFQLTIYDIEVTDHGGLIVADRPSLVEGLVKNDGEYSVECKLNPPTVIDTHLNGTIWHHDASPPPQLMLRRGKAYAVQPYSFLLPAGIATGAVGCILSLFGVRIEPQRKRHKRRRKRSVRACGCTSLY